MCKNSRSRIAEGGEEEDGSDGLESFVRGDSQVLTHVECYALSSVGFVTIHRMSSLVRSVGTLGGNG